MTPIPEAGGGAERSAIMLLDAAEDAAGVDIDDSGACAVMCRCGDFLSCSDYS